MKPVAQLPTCTSRLPPPQVGLDVWLRDGNVFKCWNSMWDVIWHGELGSSLALLNAGVVAVGMLPAAVELSACRQALHVGMLALRQEHVLQPRTAAGRLGRASRQPCARPLAPLRCRAPPPPPGFNLDSFMMRYQGVDWLDQANWDCNKRCVGIVTAGGRAILGLAPSSCEAAAA